MLTDDQTDVLTELVNIGVGRAASSLSEMVHCAVGLTVPVVLTGTWANVTAEFAAGDSQSFVSQTFDGPLHGISALVIPHHSARSLVALLTAAPLDSAEIDAEREAVLTEVGNIIINGVLGSLGNMTSLPINFGLPTYVEGRPDDFLPGDRPAVLVGVIFSIQGHAVQGRLAIVFDDAHLDEVWKVLDPTNDLAATG